jgi:hypothetical protein
MPKLIEPLEYLAEEGIRINFGEDGVFTLLVGYGIINDTSRVYIGPGEEKGAIGICYVREKVKVEKSDLISFNSCGHNLTQITFSDRVFDICRTKGDLKCYLNKSAIKVSVADYIERIENELKFLF